MNIGLVTPYFSDHKTINSGLSNHFETLAHALGEKGNKIVIVHVRPAYEEENDFASKKQLNDFITLLTYTATLPRWLYRLIGKKWSLADFALKIRCMLIVAKELGKVKKDYQLEVIETTSYFSLCYFYLFTKPGLPVVTRVSTTFLQMMDDYYPFKSRLYRLIGRLEILMIKKSRYLITHATDHANELQRIFRLNRDFVIIPHGIALPEQAGATAIGEGVCKILFIGRLEYRKGIDVLLQAIPIVIKEFPEVKFEIIGHDANNMYQNKFETAVAAEINDKVNFHGPLDDDAVRNAYKNCDIFVAPSRYESFGLIYIEAMSYGKPVIGCKVGGIPEIISDNYNGLFAIPGDPESLAERILWLCKNPGPAQEMGKNALQTVTEKFTEKILGENSIKYYRKCLTTFK